MRTMISNLPRVLVEEIISRVPMKSLKKVRLTCKKWESISKTTKMLLREGESHMIVMNNHNLYLTTINYPSTRFQGKLTCLNEQVKVSQVFHCEGLLLCILKDSFKLVVWNPYCGQQPRLIETYVNYCPDRFMHGFGYVNNKDNSCGRRYKILRFLDENIGGYESENRFSWYEVYDLDSGLWTTLDVLTPQWCFLSTKPGVSLKGNTYWCAISPELDEQNYHIICFDFTREEFGPLLSLPFSADLINIDFVTLSCVREEKLAVLLEHRKAYMNNEIEIWITTKIEAENISWSKFLKLKRKPKGMPPITYLFTVTSASFFIDEEKKVAIGFQKHFICIGDNGNYGELDLGYHEDQSCSTYVCSYVPSLVQIKQHAQDKRKRQNLFLEHGVFEKQI